MNCAAFQAGMHATTRARGIGAPSIAAQIRASTRSAASRANNGAVVSLPGSSEW